jgi:hypothetical protein
MSSLKKLAVLAVLTVVLALTAFGQQTFSTTVYLDYLFNLTDDGYKTGTAAVQAKNNVFQFRRAYFTYENKINDTLKFRFRYDADNTANITAVDFAKSTTSKDDKLRPFIKHLYLEYAVNWLQSKFNVGMIETLSFKLAEDRWGLRSVAKTLLDGYKDITGVEIDQTSADIGVTWKGTLAKYARFGVGVHNGSHYSHAETDKYKKFSGNLQLIPVAGWNVVGFVDYEKQSNGAQARTYKLETFLEMVKGLTLAGEWFTYDNENYKTAAGTRFNVGGWSVFGVYKIKPDKLSLFARYDSYEPNSQVADDEIGLIIAGADWTPSHSTWKIQPNVWITTYKNSLRKTDLVGVITFFLSF